MGGTMMPNTTVRRKCICLTRRQYAWCDVHGYGSDDYQAGFKAGIGIGFVIGVVFLLTMLLILG